MLACLERPCARDTLILRSSLTLESSDLLRQCAKGMLSVYGSQAHVDAGLRLTKALLECCPECVTAQPQFVLVCLRQASVEVKMITDEIEYLIAGLSDPGERRRCDIDFDRARCVMDCCASILESAVHHLTMLGEDSDDDDAGYDNVSVPAATASAPALDFDALQKLFSPREGPGPSDADFERERKKAAEQDKLRMKQLCQVFSRWRAFPGEVLLRLKAVLDDFVKVLATFLSVIAHTPSVGARMLSVDARIPPSCGVTTADGVSFAVHPLVMRSCHAFGRVLADDADSYSEELMDVLEFCFRLEPSPCDAAEGPACMQRPVVAFLPALMLLTVEPSLLARVCDMDAHVLLAHWCAMLQEPSWYCECRRG
jgi:hypothetical protein